MSRRDMDPYEILGLERGASREEIRKAFRRLAKKHHPDKNDGDPAAEWIFKQVHQAYERLRGIDSVQDAEEEPGSPRYRQSAAREEPQEGVTDSAKHDPPADEQSILHLIGRSEPIEPWELLVGNPPGPGVGRKPELGYFFTEVSQKKRAAPWQHVKRWGSTLRSRFRSTRTRKSAGPRDALLFIWYSMAVFIIAYALLDDARRASHGGTSSFSTDVSGAASIRDPSDPPEGPRAGPVALKEAREEAQDSREPLERLIHGGTTPTLDHSADLRDSPEPIQLLRSYRDSVESESGGTGDSVATAADPAFFYRDSHEDDVVRVQGTPMEVQRYPGLGYEVWHYGWNTVTISTDTRRVTEWRNPDGTLKVRMIPGRNVSDSEFFTRGSHADDVVRLQGTPTEIQRYSGLGYEVWHYGWNTVTISTDTRRVTGWRNSDGELKVRMIPGPNTSDSEYIARQSRAADVARVQEIPTEIGWCSGVGDGVSYWLGLLPDG